MVRSTPQSLLQRMRALVGALGYFVPSLALFATAALSLHPAMLLVLLLANSLCMAAVCHALGFDLESSFTRTVLRRGAAHFVLLAGYTAIVMLLLGWPLVWLLHDGSLAATMCLSTAIVAALLLLWRFWPAYGLVFVWDDAYPDDGRGSWIFTAVSRSLAFSRHLTGEHELYFSHGLLVGIALQSLVGAALSLAGLCGTLPSEFRIVALAIYALALAPLGNLLVANRCLRALLTAHRARHDQPRQPAPETLASDEASTEPATLPGGLSRTELDAALLRATRCGQVELALAALERGADPDTAPPAGERDQRPVLMLATTMPEVRLLRALIARRADVNRSHAGLTPLIAATRDSYQGRPDAVLTLLANGADSARPDTQGNTALHYAALASEPIVAAMLIDASAPVGSVNREGLTPLGVACAAANWALARFLLEHGARNEAEHAQPALLAAAGIADDDVSGIKLLLRHNSRVDAQGPLGRTALMAAALAGHSAIARALLEAGANPDIADSHGATALIEAARAGASAVIAALGTRRADPNRVDQLGRSALTIACQSRQARADCVRALLALGVDKNLASSDGKRALDHAVSAGRWDLVAALDPDYPLPHNLADGALAEPLIGSDSPAHLLDALRFGHDNIVEDFIPRLRQWPESERAALWLELARHPEPEPRRWLLNHGLAADAAIDGKRLVDILLPDLPGSLDALLDLFAAGASAGGAGILLRVLEVARAEIDDALTRARLIEFAQDLQARGADPYAANPQGETALHLAAQLGAVILLQELLERGQNVNARDARGRTALHFAVALPAAQAITAVRALIRHGADPRLLANDGESIVGLALARQSTDLQRWLHWPTWNLPNRKLYNIDVVTAAQAGDADAVDKLVSLGLSVNANDAQGASALLRACGQGHLDTVDRLLAAGADAELCANGGATCLSAAISAHRDTIVVRLIAHGVDLDRRLPGGGTALMIACALGFPDAAARLLAVGADPDLADDKGSTALHAAAQFAFGHAGSARARGVLDALLRHRAAPNPLNAKGQSPLLLLVGGRAEPGSTCDPAPIAALVSQMLDHAAVLDAQDERGVSPLHACAIHGLLGAARQLLARGAERNTRDCLGRTPAELAELLGYTDVAAELDTIGAMPSLAQMLRQPTRPIE
ncbi:MAG: ankyrin repeat domain-containing protein [Tahibacter sp.]